MCSLDNVTLWYRYSTDNITWGTNISFATDSSCPWEYQFNFTNGSGYYQFYSIGKSTQCGNITEYPPLTADTWCYFNWNDFLQNIVSTVQGSWTSGLLVSVIGGVFCTFSSWFFVACERRKKDCSSFCNLFRKG